MPDSGAIVARRRKTFAAALGLAMFLVCSLFGCRTPAARFDDHECGSLAKCRSTTLAKQIVADSALEVAHHPLQSLWESIYEGADQVRAVVVGGVGKRLLLPIQEKLPWYYTCAKPRAIPEDEASPFVPHDCDLAPSQVQLLPDGAEALAALERLIGSAKCSIDVLMFEWEDD